MSKNPIHKLIASIVNRLSQGSVKEVEDGITSSAEMASLCRNAVAEVRLAEKRGRITPCRQKICTVRQVSSEYQHKIPSLFVAVFHHLLKGFAVVVRARCGAVYILIDDQNVVTLGIVVAYADLSFDGLPSVDRYCTSRRSRSPVFMDTLPSREYQSEFL